MIMKRFFQKKKTKMPIVTTCSNAYVIPQTLGTDFGCGEQKFIHGVYTNSSERPSHFFHNRQSGPLINFSLREEYLKQNLVKDVTKKKGRWLYAGGLFEHFGHFLSESIHRLWKYDSSEFDGVVFSCKPNIENVEHLPSYILEVLSLFNISQDNVFLAKELVCFEELVVPEQGTVLNGVPHDWYIEHLEKIQKKVPKSDSRAYEKVWVSRENFLAAGRVLGADYFINLLEEDGYNVFRPEEHSLTEQLSIILSAKKIIWEEGSSMHLLDLIGNLNSCNLILARRPHHKAFEKLLKAKCQSSYAFFDVQCLPDFRRDDDMLFSAVSLFSNGADFFNLLKETNFYSQLQEKFNEDRFLSFEKSDVLQFLHLASNEIRNSDKFSSFLETYLTTRHV